MPPRTLKDNDMDIKKLNTHCSFMTPVRGTATESSLGSCRLATGPRGSAVGARPGRASRRSLYDKWHQPHHMPQECNSEACRWAPRTAGRRQGAHRGCHPSFNNAAGLSEARGGSTFLLAELGKTEPPADCTDSSQVKNRQSPTPFPLWTPLSPTAACWPQETVVTQRDLDQGI